MNVVGTLGALVSRPDDQGRRLKQRKPENYYELIGDDFDRFMSDYDVERRVVLMRRLWPDDASGPYLEVGCGTGAVTSGMVDLVAGATVTDISARLAADVGSRFGLPHQPADATALPFADGTFGMVYSSECIEHTPDPAAAIGEMLRVCRPGGAVLFTSPNRIWYPVVRSAQVLKLRKFQGNEKFLSADQMVAAVRIGGGSVTGISGCHLLPWQVPGIKRVLPKADAHGDHLYRFMINIAVCARKNDGRDSAAMS